MKHFTTTNLSDLRFSVWRLRLQLPYASKLYRFRLLQQDVAPLWAVGSCCLFALFYGWDLKGGILLCEIYCLKTKLNIQKHKVKCPEGNTLLLGHLKVI